MKLKCNCKNMTSAKRCRIHKHVTPAHKFLKQQFMEMGVERLAEEVLRLRKELRKYEKRVIVPEGKVPSHVIDAALANGNKDYGF